MARQDYNFPIELAKQMDPRDLSKRDLLRNVIYGVAFLLVLSELISVSRAPLFFFRFFAWTLLFVLAVASPYLPAYIKYELREDGVYLQSAVRRRTIPYAEIELATVFTDISSFSWEFGVIGSPQYHVGIYSNKEYGYIDLVASHLYEHAVLLLLKDARPVIFTPEGPERVVALIDSLQKDAKRQAALVEMQVVDTV